MKTSYYQKFVLFISILIVLLMTGGCASTFQSEETHPEKIKIGVIAPLTGNAAELGQHVRRGLEISNKGLGNRYDLIFEDDKCVDTKAATSAAEKLTKIDQVRYVIGPLCAPAYQAVSGIFNADGVAFMHTSGVTPSFIQSSGEYGISGISTTIHHEDEALAQYIIGSLGLKKLAVYAWNEEWAIEHRTGFSNEIERLGGKTVFDERFEITENDFRTAALKLKDSGAEGIFIIALNFQQAEIVKQLRESGVNIPIFGQFEIEDPAFIDAAGAAAEGIRYVYPEITEDNEQSHQFEKSYAALYGARPNYYAFIGHDALQLYDFAIRQCPTYDSRCVAKKIKNVKDFEGASGKITIRDGEILRSFTIKTIERGIPREMAAP